VCVYEREKVRARSIIPEHTSTPVAVPPLCNGDSTPVCRSTDRAFDDVRGWNVISSYRINVTVTLLKSNK